MAKKILQLILTFALIYVYGDRQMIAATPLASLDNTMWKLISWTESLPIGDTAITAAFAQNRITGLSGCNRFMGGYQVKDNTLSVDKNLAGTRMACPEPKMKLEAKFLTILPGAQQFMLTPTGNLQIVYKTNEGLGLMTFAPETQASNNKIWLDEPLKNWNQTNAIIPKATADETIDNSCAGQIRQPSTEQEKALTQAGWKLFGAVQTYGSTSVIGGMSGVDGMCRPRGYQEFVFVGGKFAGTISPVPMDSRTDGAAQRVFLQNAEQLTVEFSRYGAEDPLCCPSRTSRVVYEIDSKSGQPLLTPTSVSTEANKS